MTITASLLAAALHAAATVLEGGAAPGTATGGTAAKAAAKPKEDAAPDHGIEYETVSALVVRLSKEKGREIAVNFLKGFTNPANKKPATKGAEISPADYPRAVEEATALLEAEEELG